MFSPIDRFLNKLNYQNIIKILYHIEKNDVKSQHWMWYAFPQEKNSWPTNLQVSDKTLFYSMNLKEAEMFLKNDDLRLYYYLALLLLYIKILRKKTNKGQIYTLKLFFGDIDFLKFKSNINLFLKASKKIKEAKEIRSLILFFYNLFY